MMCIKRRICSINKTILRISPFESTEKNNMYINMQQANSRLLIEVWWWMEVCIMIYTQHGYHSCVRLLFFVSAPPKPILPLARSEWRYSSCAAVWCLNHYMLAAATIAGVRPHQHPSSIFTLPHHHHSAFTSIRTHNNHEWSATTAAHFLLFSSLWGATTSEEKFIRSSLFSSLNDYY